jgi:hypothetical protein
MLIGVLAIVFFTGVVWLVIRVSGRRFPGDITGDRHRPVDYDDPYQGWTFARNGRPEAVPDPDAAPASADDFAQWEAEQRGRHGPRRDRPAGR